jgi:hypothetical protein
MSCGWLATALCARAPSADGACDVQVLGIDVLMGCKGQQQVSCFVLPRFFVLPRSFVLSRSFVLAVLLLMPA